MWSPGRRLLTTGLILLVTLVASEALAVAVVMPRVERSLGDLGLYGWVFSAFFLGQLVGIVVAGRACDRVRPLAALHRRPGAVRGRARSSAGSATSMPMLVAARALQGLGAGALPAVAYVCIGREYPAGVAPPHVRPAVHRLGGALAGRPGRRRRGGRALRLALGLPGSGAGGAGLRGGGHRLGGPHPDARRPTRPPRAANLRDALLVAAGAGLALAGLGQAHLVLGRAHGRWSGWLVCGGAFRRLTPPGTLRARPGLPATVMVRGVLTFSFFMADAYVTYLLSTERGAPSIVAPAALTASSCLWTVGSWVQERRVGRDGPRPLVAGGFVLVAAGVGLLMVTVSPSVPAAAGRAGLGHRRAGHRRGLLAAVGDARWPRPTPGQEGAATSALQLSDVLGVALGTGLGGVIIAHGAQGGKAGGPALLAVFGVALAVSAGRRGAEPAPAAPRRARRRRRGAQAGNASADEDSSGPRPVRTTRPVHRREPAPSRFRWWSRPHRILIADPNNAHARSRKLVP